MTWLHAYGEDVFYNLLLALVGVFAAWCGLSRRHWFWRFAIAIGIAWLLVPTQAYELIVYFLLVVSQVAVVLVTVRTVHARRSALRCDGTSRRLSFSLKELLMATALAGAAMGIVALLAVQQFELPNRFFGSSVAAAILVLAACFILMNSKRPVLKLIVALCAVAIASTIWRNCSWRFWLDPFAMPGILAPDTTLKGTLFVSVAVLGLVMAGIAAIFPQGVGLSRPWARWTTRGVLALAILVALPIGGLFYYRLLFYETPPVVTLPSPNGHEVILRISKSLRNVNIPNPNIDPPDAFAPFVEKHRKTLEAVREGLALPCRIPLTFTIEDLVGVKTGDTRFVAVRRLAWALRAEGIAHEHAGDSSAAARSYVDAVRLPSGNSRGGLLVDLVYETALGRDGISWLSEIRGQLDAETCRAAARQLAAVDRNREAFEEYVRRDRIWLQCFAGWRARVLLTWEDWGFDDFSNTERLRAVDQCFAASLRLLIVELTVHAYELEHGAAPRELDDLVPEYLSEIPLDPCSDTPLRYRIDGSKPIVYAVGPDGDDDGGRALTWRELVNGGDGDQIIDFPEEEESEDGK